MRTRAPASRQDGVSIGMPVYNAEQFLAGALRALLEQTYRDLEIIICDNASIDSTQAICESFAARDARIRYVRNPVNVGAPANFNRAFSLSSRRFFKWAAHDDLVAPEFVERCLAALEEAPDAVLAFTRIAAIDDNGRRTELLPPILPALADHRPHRRLEQIATVRHGGFHLWGLMRADQLAGSGLHGPYPGGDKVLLAEMALRGRFVVVDEPLFLLRQHGGRSVKAMPSVYQRAAWHDPSRSARFMFPHWRVFAGYARAVSSTPLSKTDRYRSARVVAAWPFANWNWARLAADVGVAVYPPAYRVFEGARSWMRGREQGRHRTL